MIEYVQSTFPKFADPLCTVPEHQHKGLAAAALSRHDEILRPLGAEQMTGGGNEFYFKIEKATLPRLVHRPI